MDQSAPMRNSDLANIGLKSSWDTLGTSEISTLYPMIYIIVYIIHVHYIVKSKHNK